MNFCALHNRTCVTGSRSARNQPDAHGKGSLGPPLHCKNSRELSACADRAQSPLVYFRETRRGACYINVRRRVAAVAFFDGRRMDRLARRLAVSIAAAALALTSLAGAAEGKG